MLKLKLQSFDHLLEKTDAGKVQSQEEKGTTEDEIVGWHHRLDGHEFGQALGAGDGQGGLAGCSPWGGKELDTEAFFLICNYKGMGVVKVNTRYRM